jgi:hypothetical protein
MEEPSRMAYAWSLGCLMKVVLNTVPVQIWDRVFSPLVKTTGAFTNVRGPDEVQRCLGHDVRQMTAYVSMWENLGETQTFFFCCLSASYQPLLVRLSAPRKMS